MSLPAEMNRNDIFDLWVNGQHPVLIAEATGMTVLEILNILQESYIRRRNVRP